MPGTDAAGVVVSVGAEVTRFHVGDRVACGNWRGAWAERMVAPESGTVPMPAGVDFQTAAAVRYAYGTARYALATQARLQAGETLFVTGAAGGVGLAAVDLGRHLGARVIAGVGSRDKAAVVRDRGAEHVIVYTEEDLRELLGRMGRAPSARECRGRRSADAPGGERRVAPAHRMRDVLGGPRRRAGPSAPSRGPGPRRAAGAAAASTAGVRGPA